MATRDDLNQPDVLVVGGGPAGSAAAITCAQGGLTVTLLERQAFPRHRPGETLHPGVEPILEQLGVVPAVNSAGFLRHTGVRVAFGHENRFEPYGSDHNRLWLGYQADRERFDAILLNRARMAGAQVLQPCRALEIEVRAGHVARVLTSRGLIEPKYLIDASGARSWLARALRLRLQPQSCRLLAQYGYVCGQLPAESSIPTFRAYGKSWLWTAPLTNQLCAWTRLITPGEIIDSGWLPPILSRLRPAGPSGIVDVSWRIAALAADTNFYLAGDAASILDPACSHGVLRAVMTGIHAGHLVRAILTRNVSPFSAALRYRTWLADWFRHDAAWLTDFYLRGSLKVNTLPTF